MTGNAKDETGKHKVDSGRAYTGDSWLASLFYQREEVQRVLVEPCFCLLAGVLLWPQALGGFFLIGFGSLLIVQGFERQAMRIRVQQMTPKMAAERIGVSSSLIYQLCNEGVLRHFRFGGKDKRGKLMIDEGDLAAFIERCRREAAPPAYALKHISVG